MPALFVTGAGGFVGRHFLRRAGEQAAWSVTALTRSELPGPLPANVRVVTGDLRATGWEFALEGADTVVHLAALTGKATAAEFRETNLRATERLLTAARAAGVQRFLFVSSIAAKFADAPHYHYAESKRAAEAAVLASGMRVAIVRPTIVLGPGSPIGQRLRALAAGPVVPVFGSGRARIQPIHVNDLASILAAVVQQDRFNGEIIEAGGPDVVTMEDFLRRMHQVLKGVRPRVIHVPVRPLRSALAFAESVSIKLVPFTAGQLASFCNDGVATNGAATELAPRMRDAEEMIAELTKDA